MNENAEHPTQPLVFVDGVVRFKGNAIIMRLFAEKIIDLNEISCWDVPVEDAEQFWQLLGYSASGYGDLSFVRPEVVERIDKEAEELVKQQTVDKNAIRRAIRDRRST